MVDIADMLADLTAESSEVDGLVADLPTADWSRPTPSAGWTIAHQIGHLTWTDDAAHLAITDPETFVARLPDAVTDGYVDRGAEDSIRAPAVMLGRWRAGRDRLRDDLAGAPSGSRIMWYGTTMAPASLATARLMETWAHGLDVAEALGVAREPTARLRHIAHLGYRTLGHSFGAHGLDIPTAPVRVELSAPDGAQWTFGPADAADRVTGPALDFCLLVAQRRHRDDLALVATGPVAQQWLDVAQAFAGPSGKGRPSTRDTSDTKGTGDTEGTR
jgi:uncharacterized protein (TIGR03084 family)